MEGFSVANKRAHLRKLCHCTLQSLRCILFIACDELTQEGLDIHVSSDYNGGMDTMNSIHTEEVPRFEVAEGFILLENFEFPRTAKSDDPTYLKHFKMARALKNSAYYTVRKHCALTPFGPWVNATALDALTEEMETLAGPNGAVDVFNRMSASLNLDLRCELNLVHARVDTDQEILRRRLKRFTVDMLSEVKADLLAGALARLTHQASPFNNLDLYCKGGHVSVLRAVYDSVKEQIAVVRREIAGGAEPLEAGMKVSTSAIDMAIDYFRKSE
ncbi:MAG: hypothetical protein ACXWCS_14305 [Burkholderiales bacterium]